MSMATRSRAAKPKTVGKGGNHHHYQVGVHEEKIDVKVIDTSIQGWEAKGLLIRKQVGTCDVHAVEPFLIAQHKNVTPENKAKGRYNLVSKLRKRRKELLEIPGCGKVKNNKAVQNQDFLSMTENPAVPDSQQEELENVGREGEEEKKGNTIRDWSYTEDDEAEVREVLTTVENQNKRPRAAVLEEIPKKPTKSSTAPAFQEQITKVAHDSASSFTSKKRAEVSIKEVMDVVLDCGADYGSNEHDIATQLFVKKDQREMFMTLPTREIRFNWLTRRYNDKYGN